MIVLAGGSGSRAGGDNKVYAHLNGRPMLWYPLKAAANFLKAVRVVLVIRPQDESLASALANEFAHLDPRLVIAGATRHESERAGIEAAVSDTGATGLIGIHDGARPFLTVDLWQACLVAAGSVGGAVPVLPASPLYRLSSGRFLALPGDVFRAQTPQVFRAEGLMASFQRSIEPAPDTAETVMRHSDQAVAAVLGDRRNLKITFPADMERAAELAKSWGDGRWLTQV